MEDEQLVSPPPLPERPLETAGLERRLREEGYVYVAGADEAGRGALAGPVVGAAVILPNDIDLPGLNDSKKLDAARRERFYDEITARAVTWAVAAGTPGFIDRVNILAASLHAIKNAVAKLSPAPDLLLVDGNRVVPTLVPQKTIVKGDGLVASIAAASILAKVHRDRLMIRLAKKYPGYGFEVHKGYGAAAHLAALRELGPTPVHRRSFNPLAAWLAEEGAPLLP
jgi:ribonuclease HII